MALYSFNAKPMQRSKGHSSVEKAAYVLRTHLFDDRLGKMTEDYAKEGPLLHSEIVAPPNTPAWMLDHEKLWNGVEKAERRKDSQLGKAYIIALPAELEHAQRVELVRSFVREQWVAQGLVADFAIHPPSNDHRNHHVHIMVASRCLTADGFGGKSPIMRGTDAELKKILEAERKAWADHHNRTFERLGLEARIDERSYASRLIDRAPTKHLGAYAAERERNGEKSRIGDENRQIVEENRQRAASWRELAEAEIAEVKRTRPTTLPRRPLAPVFNLRSADPRPQTVLDRGWAQRDHERKIALERREHYALLDLSRRQERQLPALEEDQRIRNGQMKATMTAEIEAIDRRLRATGVTRFFRNVIGWTRDDQISRILLEKTLKGVDHREAEEREALKTRQADEQRRLLDRYRLLRARLEANIALQHQRRKEALGMDEPDRKVPPRADREVSRPKPEPHFKPAPPRGAGQRTPYDPEVFAKQAAQWAATPAGKEALKKDGTQTREHWSKSNHSPRQTAPHERETAENLRKSVSRADVAKRDLLAGTTKDASPEQRRTVTAEFARQTLDRQKKVDGLIGDVERGPTPKAKGEFNKAAHWSKASSPEVERAPREATKAPSPSEHWSKAATPEPTIDKGRIRGGRD